MKKLRVLLGGAESIRNLQDVMQSWGFDVMSVADGQQACDAAHRGRFDLCLLDWDLPRMSGLEVCSWMRTVDLPAQPYVVLVTQPGRPQQVQAAYIAGADDFIASPFNLENLHFLVSAFAHRSLKTHIAYQDLRHLDPLEQYRRDLALSSTVCS
ncbi:MAG TPA: response regulator [Candidatus Angelobacter sp.]|jgi:DNA-binding response OmpR family regulator